MEILFVILMTIGLASAVYVEESGSPYDEGSLTGTVEFFNLNPQDHSIPMTVRVDYPTVADEFAVLVYLTGWGGIIPSVFYSDWVSQIAAHGFIIVSPFVTDEGQTLPETLQWLEENLEVYLGGANASFANLGFVCHSAGCGEGLELLNSLQDPSFAKAAIMFDPFVNVDTQNPLPFPVVLYGTNGTCNAEGSDYLAVYNRWEASKIRTGHNTFGHCDILNQELIQICRLVCPGGGPLDDLPEYRRTTQGMAAALFIDYLQGRGDVIDYILDAQFYPITPTELVTSQWKRT